MLKSRIFCAEPLQVSLGSSKWNVRSSGKWIFLIIIPCKSREWLHDQSVPEADDDKLPSEYRKIFPPLAQDVFLVDMAAHSRGQYKLCASTYEKC